MTARRRIFWLGLAAGVLALAAVWSWPRHRANLLLITLDTTRADHLGCYGYVPARTPVLDALAAAGTSCDRAYTVAPLTLPAHASLYTGLYPAEHGIRTNARGMLDAAVPTLTEVLARKEYDTAAFVAAKVLDGKYGLARGFKTYSDLAGDNDAAEAQVGERNAESVVDAALEWLKAPRSRPFFCWVHLFDPHAPYRAHADLFGDEFAERPYDAEIAYVDQQVGRILEFLKARGLDSQTLVVVVGDHGEGLGEHFERQHGMTLYNATLRVPLIFRHPVQLAPGGRRLAANVSMVDVSPTILDLLGVADPRKTSGKSLKPALLGGPTPLSFCYGTTDEAFLINGWSPLRSLTESHWKYIRTTRPELYDLNADPREQRNLAETEPAQLHEMESRLADFESRLVPRAEVQVQISAAERRTLASLGYVAGSAKPTVGPIPANLPDVKDMLPFDFAVEECEELIKNGSRDAAIERLRKIVRDAPGHTKAHSTLAWAHWDKSEFAEAIEVFQSLLDHKPDNRDGHLGLASMLLLQDRFEAAIDELQKAIQIDPEHADAHYDLARAYLHMGKPDEALAQLDEVVELDPRHAGAYQWRARLLTELGRIDAAIADFRTALVCAPESPEAHYNLAAILDRYGDAQEAREHYSRAIELNPQSAEFQFALGDFLMRNHRIDEAILPLAKAVELKPGYAEAEQRLKEARQMLRSRNPKAE